MARRSATGSRRARTLGTVLLLAVASCGGETDAPGAQAGPSLTAPVSIKVGDVEGAPASFIAFGVQKGIFAEHRLDVELVAQQGGAAIIPNLVSGEMQIGGSNMVSVLLARSTGLPLKIIAPGTSVGADPNTDFSAVIVAADSPVTRPQDLAGKSIAVNTLKNVSEVALKAALEANGVDIGAIKLVELPFPSMLPAVEKHQVDAAFVIEPFVTMARGAGARLLLRPYVESKANLGVGTYSATEQYIRQSPAVISAFQAAAAQTARYITEHPDEYRAALPAIAKLNPALAPTVNIPVWSERVDVDSLRFLGDKMVSYGLLRDPPDVNAVVHSGP
ncbi:MAG TPA: ABC transporter substrate-binding protein [Actinophytocola sp.]|uniref:ABC transporter substrate-binding protein n=1 Tax=Actinophytocola sp. TaxID=1872138 RepID=UPI002DDD2E6A|nr:ABC transporter substrate-binding protein [Actinophytocola sp.]HEV2783477.1 ABC transporter substrate-binding protein [Actinophytocola sp.]